MCPSGLLLVGFVILRLAGLKVALRRVSKESSVLRWSDRYTSYSVQAPLQMACWASYLGPCCLVVAGTCSLDIGAGVVASPPLPTSSMSL